MSTEETKLIDLTGGKVLYDDLRERIDKVPEQIPSVPDMSIHFPGNGYKLNARNSVDSTEYASAEGYLTTASDSCAHAEGYDTTASGPYSHAEGYQTTASEEASHAEGVSTSATGQYSHAEGWGTTASGTSSHAEGNQANASGEYAHAEGSSTYAIGDHSHAEGYHTTASGSESHAEGYDTTASRQASHAEGVATSAVGSRSHTEGEYTIALGSAQHVFGAYNVSDGNPAGHVRGQYVEIVGNGTADNARSNARTLDWQGNEKLAGSLTLGTGTANEATLTAAQIKSLNGSVSVSGTTPTITALPGVRYVCGEVSTLGVTLPESGCIDVTFTSGSTATVLTITPPTGQTIKWANGFDPTSLDANTTYEINIMDGLGVAVGWT